MSADEFLDAPADTLGSADDFLGPPPRTFGGTVSDIALTGLKGAVGLGQAVVGLADIPTMGRAGKALEEYVPLADLQKSLSKQYSPAQQAAEERVQAVKGFVPSAAAMLQNPSVIATSFGEVAPIIAASAIPAGLLRTVAPKVAPYVAGAFGEMVAGAGVAAEQVRTQTPDRLLGAGQVLPVMAGAVGTGLVGAAGGKISQKFGLTDIDTLMAQGLTNVPKKKPRGLIARTAGGAAVEGGEELVQSGQEKMWQNIALGKPIFEGVPEDSARGMIVGSVMGGTLSAIMGHSPIKADIAKAKADAEKLVENPDALTEPASPAPVAPVDEAEVAHAAGLRRMEADAMREARALRGDELPPSRAELSDLGIRSGLGQLPADHLDSILADFPTHAEVVTRLSAARDASKGQKAAAYQRMIDALVPEELPIEVPPAVVAETAPVTRSYAQNETLAIYEIENIANKLKELGVSAPADTEPRPLSEAASKYKSTARKAGVDLTQEQLQAGHLQNLRDSSLRLQKMYADAKAELDAIAASRMSEADKRAATREVLRKSAERGTRPIIGQARLFEGGYDIAQEPVAAEEVAEPIAPKEQGTLMKGQRFKTQKEVLVEQAEERRAIMRKMKIPEDQWEMFANIPLQSLRKRASQIASRDIDIARARELGLIPKGVKIEETTKAVAPEAQQPEAPTAALTPEEIQNAVQIESTAGLPVREKAKAGEGMGAQVRGAEKLAEEGQGRDAASAREEIAAGPFARIVAEAATAADRTAEALRRAALPDTLENRAANILAKDIADKAEAARLNTILRTEAVILGENISTGKTLEAALEDNTLHPDAQKTLRAALTQGREFTDAERLKVIQAHNKASGPDDQIFSETGARIGKPSTVASVKAELVKDFADEGRLFRQTNIHETQADAVAAGHLSQDYAGRAKGWYDPATNKVHLIAENIEQGRVLGVFLHEMGVHAGMDRLVGKPGMDWLTSRVDQWAKLNDGSQESRAAQEAVSRASRSTSTDTSQEKIAYMVDILVDMGIKPKAGKGLEGWLHKIIGYLKLALEKLHLKASSYSGQNLVDLAYGAANIELGTVRMPTSYPGFRADAQFGFRFSEVDAAKSPQNTFNAIEGMVKAVTDSVEQAAPHVVDRASAAGRKLWLYTSGLGHIVDVVKTLKWLPPAGQEALTRLSLKLHEGDALNRNINHEATQVYDLQRRLKGGSLEALAELKGPMRRANTYPFEDDTEFEKRTGAARTPEQAREYRRARQLYGMEGVAKAYDAERAFNKKLHNMRVTAILRSLAQSEGMPRDTWEPVSVVEGLDSPTAKRLLQSIRALEKTNVDSFGRFKSLLDLNEASHAPAYFHEARFGDYVTHFEITDTPGAVDAVQNALKVAGVKDQVILTPADRGNRVFLKFANESEMLAVSNKLKALQSAGHVKEGFTAGKMAEKLKELDSSAPTFARAMMERINEDTQMLPEEKSAQMELVRRMYIGMLPEGNASKLYARNARVGGYSSDMARAFAEQSGMEAYYISQHAIRPDVSTARSDLRTTVGNMGKSALPDVTGEVRPNAGYAPVNQVKATDVLDEVNHRIANKISPVHTPIQDKLLAFGHTAGLTLSPGYLIQNLFQNIHLTWPILGGRHGFVNSAKELGKAASDAVKLLNLTARGAYKDGGIVGVADSSIAIDASQLTPSEKAALKAAVAAGRLEFTRAGEMSHIREGSSPRAERALKIANTVAYYGEVFNRITAALAAHRMETARLTKENASRPADKRLSADEIASRANTYMVDTIDNSQVNYTEADMPRFAGKHGVFKSASPLVLQFQRYNISVLQTLGKLALQSVAKVDAAPGTPEHAAQVAAQKEARKSLRGLFATTGALAGTMGLPLMGVIAGAYNALAGDDDEPVDFKTDVQNWTADVAGQDMGRLISHGAFDYMTGAAMSGKVGLDNVLPFTRLASQLVDQRRDFKDRVDAGAFQFLGPAIGIGANMAQGLGMLADGRLQQGLEKVSPAATRGLLKAYGLAEHGFTDAGGHPIGKDAAWNDIAIQAMGISPTEVSRRMEAAQGVKSIESGLSRRVSELQDRFVRAVDAGDVEARMQVVNEVTEFRRKNPSVKVDLGAAVQRARRTQASAVASGVGISGSARHMQDIREQTRFLQD